MTANVMQLRAMTKETILLNPVRARFFSYPNGDAKQNPSIASELVRIVHEQASVPTSQTSSVGLSTAKNKYIILEHFTKLTKDTVINADGSFYKIGDIDPQYIEGKVYEKRAPVYSVVPSVGNSISSCKIGTVSGVIAGTTITVTLPAGTIITSLTPVIVHNGKMIDKTTAQDFTNPVEYTITAENMTTKKYTIKVVLV